MFRGLGVQGLGIPSLGAWVYVLGWFRVRCAGFSGLSQNLLDLYTAISEFPSCKLSY